MIRAVLSMSLLAVAAPAHAKIKCPKGSKADHSKHPTGALKSEGCKLKDGTRVGPWIEYYDGGDIRAKGSYEQGMRVGPWESFYADGSKKETCGYVRDKRDGLCETFYASGKKAESGEWSDGKRNGAWLSWYEDGAPHEEGTYGADYAGTAGSFKQGDWVIYHPNGQKMLEAHYEVNQADGPYLEWYPNGAPMGESIMAKGKKVGDAVTFHPNGVKEMIATYREGLLDGQATYYDPSGRKVEVASYKEGKRSGKSTRYQPDGKVLAVQCFQWGERQWVSTNANTGKKCPLDAHIQFRPAINKGHDFSDGFAAVRMGTQWGYIDTDGKVAIAPKFLDAGNFVGGFAAVTTDGKEWFAINTKGTRDTKKPPAKGASGSTSGITKHQADDGHVDYRKNGRSLWAPAEVEDGDNAALFPVQKDGKWGFIDATGKVAIEARYDAAGVFSEGLAAVADRGRLGFIDKSGEWVIDPRFTSARPFHCGMAVVGIEGRLTYVDKLGIRLTEKALSEAEDCQHGLARVKVGDALGFFHPSGKMVIPATFTEVGLFHGHYAIAAKDAAYIDRTGQKLFEGMLPLNNFTHGHAVVLAKQDDGKQKYGVIGPDGAFTAFELVLHAGDNATFGDFSDGVVAANVKGKVGYLGADGKTVVKPTFEDGRGFAEGLAAVKTDKGWGFIDKTGKEVIKPAYSEVGDFEGGLAAAAKDGKWGYVDKEGKWKVEAAYDKVRAFRGELARVHSNGSFGYVDKSGKVVWKPSK